tara:strand:+ start:102 stop:983 length:882 start_codon:yes stop_codon:yes gene_type:complete
MKNLKYFISLSLSLLFFTACEEDTYEFGEITTPTNLAVTVVVVGLDAENPNGDGSGVVNIVATADDAISYKFIFNGAEEMVASGVLEKTFYAVGLNSYDLTVVAYGTAGSPTSTTLSIEVLTTYTPPAELVLALTGGSSKTWRVKSEVDAHFGLGPVGGLIPCQYYPAPAESKVGTGTYDDRWTFNSDGTLNHMTNGNIFGRTAQVFADLGDNGTGSEDGADILNYEYADYTENWNIIDPGQLSIKLTNNAFFTYYTGGDHTYELYDYNENELYIRTVDGAGEFTWWMILVAE